MTPLGYRLAMALASAIGILGVALATPSAAEIGFLDERDCEAFLARPEAIEGVRLTECSVDPTRGYDGSVLVVSSDPDAAPLFATPSDPTLRMLVDERYDDEQAVRRYLARHPEVGARTYDFEGDTIPRGPYATGAELGFFLQPHVTRGGGTAGVVLAIFGLGLALLLFGRQRAWRRRERTLRGETPPLSF